MKRALLRTGLMIFGCLAVFAAVLVIATRHEPARAASRERSDTRYAAVNTRIRRSASSPARVQAPRNAIATTTTTTTTVPETMPSLTFVSGSNDAQSLEAQVTPLLPQGSSCVSAESLDPASAPQAATLHVVMLVYALPGGQQQLRITRELLPSPVAPSSLSPNGVATSQVLSTGSTLVRVNTNPYSNQVVLMRPDGTVWIFTLQQLSSATTGSLMSNDDLAALVSSSFDATGLDVAS